MIETIYTKNSHNKLLAHAAFRVYMYIRVHNYLPLYFQKRETPSTRPFQPLSLVPILYPHTHLPLCFNCHVGKEEGSVDSEGGSTFSYKCSRIKFLTVFFLKDKKIISKWVSLKSKRTLQFEFSKELPDLAFPRPNR